jgi:hypothetical protein
VREYPYFNRFIINRKFYEHTDFSVSVMVTRAGAEPTMSKVYFDFNDDVFTVHRKIEEYISANKVGPETNDADKVTRTLMSIPGLAAFASGLTKLLDKHGLAPRALIDASPFHASMAVSNLVSIQAPRVFHHLFEFGTISTFLTIGLEEFVPVKNRNDVEMVRCIPLSFNFDERICSGVYFAKAMEKLSSLLEKPELLEGA